MRSKEDTCSQKENKRNKKNSPWLKKGFMSESMNENKTNNKFSCYDADWFGVNGNRYKGGVKHILFMLDELNSLVVMMKMMIIIIIIIM